MDDRLHRLERDLRLFKRYTAGMTLAVGVVILAAFQQSGRTRFTEIDAERVNVVEENGTIRLAIANAARFAPITFYGKEYPGVRGGTGTGAAGMIFFNDEGTENGGWGWQGRTLADGSHLASGTLAFDQYNQDETLTLHYSDTKGQRQAGLSVFDQPDESLQPSLDSILVFRAIADSAERAKRVQAYRNAVRERGGQTRATRLFAGRNQSKASVVALSDRKGRPRLRLVVDSVGTAKMEFLDENGRVTQEYPSK